LSAPAVRAPAAPAALRAAAAIEQHHAREVLIVDPTAILIAAADRLARHFAVSEVAPEITRRAAAHALNAEQPHHTSLDLQCPRILHDRHAADDGRIRCRLRIARVRRGERRHPRLRPEDLGANGGGLGDEVVPNARRQIAVGHAPCGAVIVVANPHAHDLVVGESDEPRTRWSPSTAITLSLTPILRANATIRNVVLTGVATDVCVGTTARGAFMRDYYAVMVDDGTATFSPEDHASTLRNSTVTSARRVRWPRSARSGEDVTKSVPYRLGRRVTLWYGHGHDADRSGLERPAG
jgi:hypothetical protein